MQDRPSLAPNPTPLHQRPGFLTLCLAIVSVAFLFALFGGDDDGRDDPDEAALAADPWGVSPPDVAAPGFFQAVPASAYEAGTTDYATGYQGYVQMPAPTGNGHGGYGEAGAFRGEAPVGGLPLVSGTIDESGEGNQVFSVGGRLLELP